MSYPGLAGRVAEITATIARHQTIGGWTHPVRIVAVTKTHGPEAVEAAVAAGLTIVGENKVQEALAKQDALGKLPVEWHLIGALQRNKVRKAIGRFALIHSVDRLELAAEIARRLPDGTRQAVLLEVNGSGEAAKAGCQPEEVPGLLDAMGQLPGLEVRGLMTMAPFTDDVAVQRRTFRALRELRDRMQAAAHPLPELSMGMSGDYTVAVEEGATLVRLGTLLFGARH